MLMAKQINEKSFLKNGIGIYQVVKNQTMIWVFNPLEKKMGEVAILVLF